MSDASNISVSSTPVQLLDPATFGGFRRLGQRFCISAMTVTALLLAGQGQAVDVRLGLNSSLSLGCEVVGVRAGVQKDRFGGFVQGAFCKSNVAGKAGSPVFGGALTFDIYQSDSINAYVLAGARTDVGNPRVYGGLGLSYGVPLIPVEGYLEAGGSWANDPILGSLPGVQVALGVNYVWRGVDLSAAGGESRPSNISRWGTSGLNVDQQVNSGDAKPNAASNCKVTPETDAEEAEATALSAANSALSSAASGLAALYSNIEYNVEVSGADINGNRATVDGTVHVSAVRRSDNEEVSDSYDGVVLLVRSGCGWRAVSYERR